MHPGRLTEFRRRAYNGIKNKSREECDMLNRERMETVADLRRLPPLEHPMLSRGILELTDIRSEPYPGASVVPAYCRAT